ncbi:MAG: penicillin-binding transpeptidase domain-containing protein, partial [Pseudomonadota bacterium]
EEHGTANTAFKDSEYKSAGKTGTAQLFTVKQDEEYDEENVDKYLRDNAMYVGYAPFDAPEISVVVTIENAGGGGSNAAPMARQIMDYYYSLESQYIAKSDTDTETDTVLHTSNE